MESKEAVRATEALQSRLAQATAAEDGLRARCQQLEAQAATTASQVQELQQQVCKPVFHSDSAKQQVFYFSSACPNAYGWRCGNIAECCQELYIVLGASLSR